MVILMGHSSFKLRKTTAIKIELKKKKIEGLWVFVHFGISLRLKCTNSEKNSIFRKNRAALLTHALVL